MTDHLEGRPPAEVAAFYRRLAHHVRTQLRGASVAAELLLHWLDGKGTKRVVAALYLKDVSFVKQ